MMKKILFYVLVVCSVLCSCESKGPKGRYYEDTRTAEETLQDMADAGEGDGWFHSYDTDVFYLEDGEWVCYGKVGVYKNLEDSPARKWVDFGGMKCPAEDTDKGGYSYRVQYGGTWYYF